MLFNSIEFLLFLPTIFILYWFVFNKNLKYQNTLILVSSYVFYGWWDYRFLSLIFLSTVVDYIIGLNIPKQNSEKNQKLLLWCSVLFNLSVLGFFKYYNFFIDSCRSDCIIVFAGTCSNQVPALHISFCILCVSAVGLNVDIILRDSSTSTDIRVPK